VSFSVAEHLARALLDAGVLERVTEYVPDAITTPAAFVSFPAIDYGQDMGGGLETVATFTVYVVLQKGLDRASAAAAGPYISPQGSSSIKAALESDPTLGGAVSSLRVTRATVAPLELGGSSYLAASFTVEVYLDDYYFVS